MVDFQICISVTLKKVKNTHGGVLLLVKFQAKSLQKATLPYGRFSRFLNCTFDTKSSKALRTI